MEHWQKSTLQRIAFIGNSAPRQCGIATFTNTLIEAVNERYPLLSCYTVAMNDIEEGYEYPSQVRFEIPENDIEGYHRAASYLNFNEVDILSLQHEYGIFGGPAGSHILTLLREVNMPVVTTLHTILRDPTREQFEVMKELSELSNRLVVMSQKGRDFLKDIYHIPAGKINFVPHGIPDVPFVDPNFYKDKFGVEGKFVILTFGLLSRNKGIENVIKALPEITAQNPDVMYIVLGATHPNVIRSEGESYRQSLEELTDQLGMRDHVHFINQFVSQQELVEYIGATDLYITPYLNEQQITSGTLAYTVGAGKAVLSTPYWYAEELLADERGVLVPFADPKAVAEKINELIGNEAMRHAMRKRAYLLGREMIWPKVAEEYINIFERARHELTPKPRSLLSAQPLNDAQLGLPPLNLYHLTRMTDNTGLLQHAVYSLPNYQEGYTTDDNARALMVAVMLERLGDDWFSGAEELGSRYLAFLQYAFNRVAGRFRNFMSFERHWLENRGSEDSHGRAIWGLGLTAGHSNHDALQSVAGILFTQGLPAVLDFSSPRAWAYALLGISEYMNRYSGDRMASQAGGMLAQRLYDIYLSTSSDSWAWFENSLTYGNATLAHALLVGGRQMNREDMQQAGLHSLRWLFDLQTEEGVFSPVGNHGFYTRGAEKARFDQQPIEAHSTISAALEAYRLTGDDTWRVEAQRAFNWFMGDNLLGISLYDAQTGGCRDGLQPDRVNQNQGAESTLSFQLSLLELRLLERFLHTTNQPPAPITLLSLKANLK